MKANIEDNIFLDQYVFRFVIVFGVSYQINEDCIYIYITCIENHNHGIHTLCKLIPVYIHYSNAG